MARAVLGWGALALAILLPLAVATQSPWLAYREPVYILAGFAGIVGLALLLVQPLLAGGLLPGAEGARGRSLHKLSGAALVLAVLAHVGALWITSPPDVVDALTFTAPTWFSVFGVIALWATLAAAGLAVLRRRIGPRLWRIGHTAAVLVVVTTTVAHAALIEGTMGTASKLALCALVVLATLRVVVRLRAWRMLARRRA